MALDQYRLSQRFIRETELDLAQGLKGDHAALQYYEKLVHVLNELERLSSSENNEAESQCPLCGFTAITPEHCRELLNDSCRRVFPRLSHC